MVEIDKTRSHPLKPRHASLYIQQHLAEVDKTRSHPLKPRHASLCMQNG
jgi:hypothetical protein